MARQLFIQQAVYVSGLSVELKFNDGTVREINFGDFIKNHPHPQYNKYLNPSNFINFFIDHGNIVWGKNWDLVFPIEKLYSGDIS
jgi:hypothetical protein